MFNKPNFVRLFLLCIFTLIGAVPIAQAANGASQLLITEIVVTPTGGEFVEIYNPNDVSVDLSNVYLTDATFAGGSTYYYNLVTGTNAGGGDFSDFFARFPDGATIAAGEYQTVAMSGSDAFFTEYGENPDYELFEDAVSADAIPDMREAVSGSINGQGGLTNSGEVVVLFYWDGASDLVTDLDYVVWGDKDEAIDKTGVSIDGPDGDATTSTYLDDTAIASQDVVAGGSHTSGQSWQRGDLTEGNETKTGGNGADGHDETSEDLSVTFCTDTPTPNAATSCKPPVVLGSCGNNATLISTIQGSGFTTPESGNEHVVEGVVVGDFQTDDGLNGFFLQEEDADADGDPATSEGIFVYTGGGITVNVGDVIRVKGFASEYFDMTQISLSESVICSNGNALPATTALTLPLASEDDLEPVEGMLVESAQTLYVTETYNLGRYGEVSLSINSPLYNPTERVAPGTTANDYADNNNLNRILLDDGSSNQWVDPVPYLSTTSPETLRRGDTVSSMVGVINYAFGSYRFQPTETLTFVNSMPRPSAPAATANLRVASFNVLNYFTTIDDGVNDARGADSASEFTRQQDKLVAALQAIDADIFGLMEIENNGTAVSALVDALNSAVGAGTYSYINTGVVGTDAITVAIIYKSGSVTPNGNYATLTTGTFNGLSRPPVAQTFTDSVTGKDFTIVVNHFKSKGCGGASGDDTDQGDGQSCYNATRVDSAKELSMWLATDPTGTGAERVVIIGDLNAYSMEDPIVEMEFNYTNLVKNYVAEADRYTYVFFGEAGVLDHAFASEAAAAEVESVSIWHINSDEPRALDYNDNVDDAGETFTNKPLNNDVSLYAPDEWASSDHDPVIVDFSRSVELLSNGGFEVNEVNNFTGKPPADKQPDDWRPRAILKGKQKCNKDTDGDNVIDKIVAYEGSCMYLIKGRFLPQRLVQVISDDSVADLNAGDTLKLSGYLKTNNASERAVLVAKIKYVPVDADTKPAKDVIRIYTEPGDTQDWHYVASDVVTLSDDVFKIKVLVRYPGLPGSNVKFDAVSLEFNNGTSSTLALPETRTGVRSDQPLALPDAPSGFRK